jgi:hypothetical protein
MLLDSPPLKVDKVQIDDSSMVLGLLSNEITQAESALQDLEPFLSASTVERTDS